MSAALQEWEVKVALSRRYYDRFGEQSLGHFNDFAQAADEMILVMERSLERGTPMTEGELAWLNRHVRADVIY
ncbi:hypothetical protein [Xanthobacter aminoxidans]|uniref:hypothetical protein n=1 Tax=Xanthobacter aminoxidans TaxID=186280 RepID=UPI002022EED4|nr:hypothetical protein [Xanthobacter aminoxidans]MCL8381767.1 hypothetical protein [Xanthobacter aminoxidans]